MIEIVLGPEGSVPAIVHQDLLGFHRLLKLLSIFDDLLHRILFAGATWILFLYPVVERGHH